jgi:hypothetical protein
MRSDPKVSMPPFTGVGGEVIVVVVEDAIVTVVGVVVIG